MVFSCEFSAIFQTTLFTEHFRMTAPADSSVPTKVLSIGDTFPLFFLLLLIILIMGVYSESV